MGIKGTGKGLGLALVVAALKELISSVMVRELSPQPPGWGSGEALGQMRGVSCR